MEREHRLIPLPDATIEWLEPPIVRSCRELIDALTVRVKETDNSYAATQASASVAAIVKELRKAGFFEPIPSLLTKASPDD